MENGSYQFVFPVDFRELCFRQVVVRFVLLQMTRTSEVRKDLLVTICSERFCLNIYTQYSPPFPNATFKHIYTV